VVDTISLIERGDALFSQRSTLMTMWQEIAENFYPERADFTVTRALGDSFADNLTTSYPILVKRDLANSLGTMMRPTNIEWFHMTLRRDDRADHAGAMWLDEATTIMRRAMYDRASMFTRATKEADHDMAAFGQSVKSVETNMAGDQLLYRCWHLRDVAWCENAEGKIDTVHRKWKPTARELCQLFRDKVHTRVHECVYGTKKQPNQPFNVRHILMPAADFAGESYLGKKLPYVSIYLDVDNKHIMEMVGRPIFNYVIPRWQTVSGSQYAFSPATVAGLPDARLLQAMTRTLLEAGEKAVSPPLIGVEEAIRSDVAIYAGGITWVDEAYDERLGEVLRPLNQDLRGFNPGIEMQDRVMAMMREAFFLNRLTLPQQGPEMTAYEVGQRVQEYIRQAAPIFEPLEDEDNAALCEVTFDVMLRAGAFGQFDDIPQSVRGEDIEFRFESPLHDAIERQKGQKFMEAASIIGQAASLDQSIPAHLDIQTAFRDVLKSIGVPNKWMRSEEDAGRIIQQTQEMQQQAALLEQLQQGAMAAKTAGEAGQAMTQGLA
jgi:hypothetical protein